MDPYPLIKSLGHVVLYYAFHKGKDDYLLNKEKAGLCLVSVFVAG